MTRQKNPRRAMLAALKAPRERLKWLHDRWTWTGSRTVWINEPGRLTRPREKHEYPENIAIGVVAREAERAARLGRALADRIRRTLIRLTLGSARFASECQVNRGGCQGGRTRPELSPR